MLDDAIFKYHSKRKHYHFYNVWDLIRVQLNAIWHLYVTIKTIKNVTQFIFLNYNNKGFKNTLVKYAILRDKCSFT